MKDLMVSTEDTRQLIIDMGGRGGGKSYLMLLALEQAKRLVVDNVKLEHTGYDTPCWIWQKGNDGRYGHAYLFSGRIKTHVLAFLAWSKEPLKRHHVVDHLCNVTLCCNPAHLRAATQSQNIARCFAEGRGRSPFLRS